MIEKEIYLDDIDPLHFLGVNNSNFEILRAGFPKIKIVSRGNKIKIMGDPIETGRFEQKIQIILDYVRQYNSLTKETLLLLLESDNDDILTQIRKEEGVLIYGASGKAIKARNTNQKKLINEYESNDLIFAIGPAGTGKTYIAIALAIRALKNKEIKRIILSRPAVEAGERLGFLPGDMKEKLDPYLQPLYDALLEMVPAKKLADLFEDGVIQIAPLAFMRGRTLSNCFVILDEAQNSTVNQLKMFLTRMGENSKFIVTGDITQIDLPDKRTSGLVVSRELLKGIEGISMIDFDHNDIIRHRLVRFIVDAYTRQENALDGKNITD